MKKSYYNYVGTYTFTYGAMGMLLPLLPQYLNEIGFTGTEIGSIMSTGTGVAIFASIFWGGIYNNSSNGKKVILFLCLVTSLTCVLLSFVNVYIAFLLIFGLLYFFQSPILALQDSMTLEDKQDFGSIRKWGAIGFATGNFVASRFIIVLGLHSIFYLYTVGYILAGIMVALIMKKNGKVIKFDFKAVKTKAEIKGKTGYVELFKNRKFTLLIISAFFVSGTNVANNTYFGFLYIDGGGTLAGIGIAFLLMAGSEAVFMAWSDKLADMFTLEKTILVSMIISVFRYFIYSLGPSYSVLLFTFFLQGMVNGIVLVELVRYIYKIVEPRMLGLAVSAYYCVSCNISTIVCLMIGGIILDNLGSSSVYFFFAVYNLTGVILYILWGLHKPTRDEKNVEKLDNKG